MNRLLGLLLVCWLLPVFSETVDEVQIKMNASIPQTKNKRATRLSASPNGESTQTYEGSGDLNIIKGEGQTIYVYFSIDDSLKRIESATLDFDAYDVDYPWATERDIVYFNGIQIGRLTGGDGVCAHNSFEVPLSAIKVDSINSLTISVDVDYLGWVTGIANARLTLSGFKGNQICNVTSAYCSGRYGKGRKATFLTSVDCDVEFDVEYDAIVRPIDHLRVNGERYSNIDTWFSYDVGSLNPGDRLEVVAVDVDGNESEPFRVNLDIAAMPEMWEYGVGSDGHARIKAVPNPRDRRVTYVASDYNVVWLWDAVLDGFSIGNVELPLVLSPKVQTRPVFESDTGKFRETADVGFGASVGEGYLVPKQQIGEFAGASLGITASGGRIYQWQPQPQTWKQTSWDVGIRITGSCDPFEMRIPQTLNLVYFKLGILADLSFVLTEDEGAWHADINGDPLAAIRGTVGAGCDGVACVEGFAQGGLVLHATLPGSPTVLKDLGVQLKLGWRAVILGFERNGELDYVDYIVGGSRLMSPMTKFLASNDGTAYNYRLISRDYGGRITDRPSLRLMSKGGVGSISLGDGYPNPAPFIAANGYRDCLVYLRDNQSRTAINRTEIVCRFGVSNEWNEAESVWDDGTADFMPNVSFGADGTVFATWANANRVLGDDAPLGDVCRSMEVAVGVKNAETGIWSCRNLTEDTALDMTPKVMVAPDGSAVVAWVRNASGEFIGSSEKPSSIMLATYRGGSWSAPFVVAADVGLVYSFDIAHDGSTTSILYAKDGDGDPATSEAREVWGVSVMNGVVGNATRLSSAGTDATRPFAWYDANGVLRTLWLEGENLVSGIGFGPAHVILEGCDITPDFSFVPRADGGAMLVWKRLAASESGAETVCATYDPLAEVIGDASLLFRSDSAQERSITGAVGSDGALRMAYESVSVTTNSAGAAEYGAVELKTFRRESGMDVGFADDSFCFEGEVIAGETTNILVKVTNFGTEAANGVAVNVWFGEVDRTLLGTVVTNIAPMSAVTVSVPWLAEHGAADMVFTASVDGGGTFADRDETNNSAIWRPQFPDVVTLYNAYCFKDGASACHINATVRNDGLSPLAEGTEIRFWRGEIGEELLAVTNLNMVLSGLDNEQDVGFTWDFALVPMTAAVERVVVELVSSAIRSTISVDVESPVCKVTFVGQNGEDLGIDPLYVLCGHEIGVLPMISDDGNLFVWMCNGDIITANTKVLDNMLLVADFAFKYSVSDGVATITDCDTRLYGDIEIPSFLGGYPVVCFGSYAFYGCSGLTSVTIGNSVTSIQASRAMRSPVAAG